MKQLLKNRAGKPVVYLAGAIDACSNAADTHGWRAEAEELLTRLGFEVKCPICHGEGDLFGKTITEQQCVDIVDTDFNLVKQSHYLLVNGETRSEGTAMEILRASEQGKTIIVYGLQNQQRTFVRAHADLVLEDVNLEKAIELLYEIESTFQIHKS